jgi:serine/threonine-protein phosphatase 2B catalytic subunit
MDTFDALPLAAIMNKQFFCVHGGISPEIETIEEIYEIHRFIEPPSSGRLCDLLWADPVEDYDNILHSPSIPYQALFSVNDVRSCSYTYPFQASVKFLERNKLLSIIRAHEAQSAGYKMHRRNDKTGFPTVITLFSAPNYLDFHGNKAAVLRYENNVFNIRQFNHSPHPFYLPGFKNVFNWTLPFMAERVAELLVTVFNLVDDDEADRVDEIARRREVIRRKVMTVSKLLLMYKRMREERESLLLAGSLSPSGYNLPRTLSSSLGNPQKVKRKLSSSLEEDTFKGAKRLDLPNEARPPNTELLPLSASVMTPQQLKRYASRDQILLWKRNSLPSKKKQHQEMIKDSTGETPHITEEHIKDTLVIH